MSFVHPFSRITLKKVLRIEVCVKGGREIQSYDYSIKVIIVAVPANQGQGGHHDQGGVKCGRT